MNSRFATKTPNVALFRCEDWQRLGDLLLTMNVMKWMNWAANASLRGAPSCAGKNLPPPDFTEVEHFRPDQRFLDTIKKRLM